MSRRLSLPRRSSALALLPLAASLAQGCGPVSAESLATASSDGGTFTGPGDAAQDWNAGFVYDAGACAPGDVAAFKPGPYVPAAAPQNVCTSTDLTNLYDYCLGPSADAEPCTNFQQTNGPCYACVVTASTASSNGPVIEYAGSGGSTFVEANVAGCLQVASGGSVACAMSVQAVAGCELAACLANCPVTSGSSLAAFQACGTAAQMQGCRDYSAQASCLAAADAGPLAACTSLDFGTFYLAVAPLFCSSVPVLEAGQEGQESGVLDASAD